MATQSDVAQAMVDLIAAAIYPDGTSAAPVTGVNVRVFQGWPVPEQQAKDFAAEIVQVSVFPTHIGRELPSLGAYEDGPVADHQATRTTELRREERQFQITVWAWCFDKRELVAKVVDIALQKARRLTLADGTMATLRYVNSYLDDGGQKQGIYRSDLFYMADFAVAEQETLDEIQHTELNLSGGPRFDTQGPVVTRTQP